MIDVALDIDFYTPSRAKTIDFELKSIKNEQKFPDNYSI